MNAIIYESQTGSAARYAQLLAEHTGLPAYTRKQAQASLHKGDAVLFIGWIMAGRIKGLAWVRRRYAVQAVCAVGMGKPTEQDTAALCKLNKIADTPLFCLQGGCDTAKLRGFSRRMMLSMQTTLARMPNRTEEENEKLALFAQGAACATEENLAEVFAWLAK